MVGVQSIFRSCASAWLLLGFVGLMATPSGCERRDCEQERRHCEGAAIVSCVSPCSDVGCHRTWEYEQCAVTCVQSEDGWPFCALSSVPDANCVAANSCGPDGPIACLYGYRTAEQKCDTGTQCVPLNGSAFCAVNGAPDARCSDITTQAATCVGNALLRCALGFAVEDVSCPDGCVAGVGCVLSNTVDPRCDPVLTHVRKYEYCESATTRVSCLDGYRIKATECDCVEYEGNAFCG